MGTACVCYAAAHMVETRLNLYAYTLLLTEVITAFMCACVYECTSVVGFTIEKRRRKKFGDRKIADVAIFRSINKMYSTFIVIVQMASAHLTSTGIHCRTHAIC